MVDGALGGYGGYGGVWMVGDCGSRLGCFAWLNETNRWRRVIG